MTEMLYINGGYTVNVRSDGVYFTVYVDGDVIAGTICRPHRGDPHWVAWSLDGKFLGNSIGPRTALGKIARHCRAEREQAMVAAYVAEGLGE